MRRFPASSFSAVGVLAFAALQSSQAAPQIEELGWVLEREIDFADPISALYNPIDGRIYAGDRDADVFVVNEDGTRTQVGNTAEVAGLAVDPRDGDLYMSEDFPGRVRRMVIGLTSADTWVSGFDSGDDDPAGICFVPEDYVGTLFTPGGMALTDRGFGSANEIWSFDPSVPETESEVFDDGAGGEMVDPFDIAVRADGLVVIADSTNGLQFLIDNGSGGGVVVPFMTVPALTAVDGVAIDGRRNDLFAIDSDLDAVVRVNIATGVVSTVISNVGLGVTEWGSVNIDTGPETQRMVVSARSANKIYVFAAVPGCNNADLSVPFGLLDLSDVNLFVTAFTGGNPIADFDDNGLFDLSDVIEYIDAFGAGCP